MVPTRNFHLPLPDPLYRRLRAAAARRQQPATALARYAIDHWLRDQQRSMVREAVAAYAAEMSRTGADLDEELEAASLELVRGTRAARRRRRRTR